MTQGGGRGLKFYMFSSFFGAAMIAATYAYFNYKYSLFNFIDFSQSAFYSKNNIFAPKEDSYTILVYSSKKDDIKKLLERVEKKEKILAIDLAGNRFENTDDVEYLTAGINTLLPIINKFKINEVPIVFNIEKINKENFKQTSKIESFD